jgi:hypothetical protein
MTTTGELEEEVGRLNLEMTVLEFSDDQLRQVIRIIGRELGRRGLAEYKEEEQ